MSQKIVIKHPLENHILSELARRGPSRFMDLRPDHIETNSLAYHLKRLLYFGLILKRDDLYGLGRSGRTFLGITNASRQSAASGLAVKICFVIQNSNGDVLIEKQAGEAWALPSEFFEASSTSLVQFASATMKNKFRLDGEVARHVGDAYVRITRGTAVFSAELLHVFKFDSNEITAHDNLTWERPHKLGRLKLAAGTEAIMARAFFNDPFFFEEFIETTNS